LFGFFDMSFSYIKIFSICSHIWLLSNNVLGFPLHVWNDSTKVADPDKNEPSGQKQGGNRNTKIADTQHTDYPQLISSQIDYIQGSTISVSSLILWIGGAIGVLISRKVLRLLVRCGVVLTRYSIRSAYNATHGPVPTLRAGMIEKW
jgi:hypothetical protein